MGLLMGMSERVSGNGKWSNMWHMEGVDGQKFAYTWQRLEEKLSEDYQKNNGKGLNWEMVKAWPIWLLAAGAGLHLYDQINNDGGVSKQKVHTSANEWLDGVFKDEYCVFDDKTGALKSVTLYYDAELEYNHKFEGPQALGA